jgi:putative ABC transport system permease protein
MMRVPLAWCNLTSDRGKFILSALAIGFAVMLLFVQLGFYNSLMDSSILLIEKLNADLVVIHERREYISFPQGFPRHFLQRLKSVAGVEAINALSMDVNFTPLRKPGTARSSTAVGSDGKTPGPNERLIRVLAVDPEVEALALPELSLTDPRSQVARLRVPGQALFDRESRPEFGLQAAYARGQPFEAELAGQRLQIVGAFTLGRDFTAEGNLIVSETTFRDYLRTPFPFLDADYIDLGLVRLQHDASGRPVVPVAEVQRQLQARLNELGKDVGMRVITRDELARREQRFWINSTPVGQVFFLGLLMGMAVGAVICYQILSSGVADRIAEYATLRAIGYSNKYLAWVVIQEALILAGVGFLPGLGAAVLVYQGLEWATGLPLRFSVERILWVLGASLVMCSISGVLAVREAQRVDPAEVF